MKVDYPRAGRDGWRRYVPSWRQSLALVGGGLGVLIALFVIAYFTVSIPDPNKLAVAQTIDTTRGARTMALDPATHRIYLPTAQFQPAPSPSPGMSPGRPTIVPNTFKLLVYGPE